MANKFYLDSNSIFNLLFKSNATPVVLGEDDVELVIPGMLFLDENSTEGVAEVELLNGGTCVIPLTKDKDSLFIVKKILVANTTADGIFVNPISQKK